VIVTPVAVPTFEDETEKVALVFPEVIVTEAGTDATAGLPLESDMTTPPVGAGPIATIVAVELFPPTTEFGAKAREESPSAAGVTLTEAVPALVESCVLVPVTVAVVAFAGAV
jgi:hypothetical protein